MDTRTCVKCKEQRSLKAFYFRKDKELYKRECKQCTYEYFGKTFRAKNPTYTKNAALKKKYGISYSEKLKLLEQQNNQCEICKKSFSKTVRSCVDHEHATGKVRGILCVQCNAAYGQLKEDETIIQGLLNYHNKYKAKPI